VNRQLKERRHSSVKLDIIHVLSLREEERKGYEQNEHGIVDRQIT
jgi:hypothetical protein